MNEEWQVKSVVKSGDSIHVELEQLNTGPVGIVSAVLATAVIAVIAWAFFMSLVWDPIQQRNRVWTAATNQTLECGDPSTGHVTFWWSWDDVTWHVAQKSTRGANQYYLVVVDDTPTGARAQGEGVSFVYSAAERRVESPELGTWNDCLVRLKSR